MCVCVRACVRAYVRARVCACTRVYAVVLMCPCIVRSTGGLTIGDQNVASDNCLLRPADYQYTDGKWVGLLSLLG